jgi:hypothetical protein
MFRRVVPTIVFLSATMLTVHASTLFSGSGTSGASSGQGWYTDFDTGDFTDHDDWGMPGLGAEGPEDLGTEPWANPAVNLITFTFSLPNGITIEPGGAGMVAAGRFWNAAVSPDGLTVTFTPLSAIYLNPGDNFELSVVFTSFYSPGDAVETNFSFTGFASSTPEPATIVTLGIGLACLTLGRCCKKTAKGSDFCRP